MVMELDLLYKGLERMSATDKKTIQQLQAESQSLRDEISRLKSQDEIHWKTRRSLLAENQALKEDNTLLDVKLRELRIEYRKLESYLAEREGYQP